MKKNIFLSIITCLIINACVNQTVSTATNTSTNTPSLGDHFPQLVSPPNAYYDLPLTLGKLTLENGCLRLSGVKDMSVGDSFLLIWDPRFSTRTEKGVVHVIDSLTGKVLASTGDFVEVGYNGNKLNYPTSKPIPEECHGPYMIVGETIKKIDHP